MTDFACCSHELLATAGQLEGLLAQMGAVDKGGARPPAALSEVLQAAHSRMAAMGAALLADAERALSGEPEIESLEDGVAAASAAAALEPGYRALQDLALFIAQAPGSGPRADPAFIDRVATTGLSIGLRQCLRALAPLAERMTRAALSGGAPERAHDGSDSR